jgi:hypothetical protein
MKDFVPIIVAIIALIGTVIGIYIGFRKSQQDRDSGRFGQYEKDRQGVYRDLWDRVEQFNIKARIELVEANELSAHLQSLNAFMLRSGIYLDDADRNLVNQYVEAAYNFQKVVRESGLDEAEVPLGKTQAIPYEIIQAHIVIGKAQNEALKLRSQVIEKVRRVLGGKPAIATGK